jgi:hypothetical protein
VDVRKKRKPALAAAKPAEAMNGPALDLSMSSKGFLHWFTREGGNAAEVFHELITRRFEFYPNQ